MQLTDASGVETGPSISPDGTSFAYSSPAHGSWDIYVQRVGGRNPILVAGDPARDTQREVVRAGRRHVDGVGEPFTAFEPTNDAVASGRVAAALLDGGLPLEGRHIPHLLVAFFSSSPAILAGTVAGERAAVLPVIPNSPPFNTPALAGYPQYQPGQLAKMCVSQYGWTSLGRDSSGNIILQQWMKFIDQADGFVSRDF